MGAIPIGTRVSIPALRTLIQARAHALATWEQSGARFSTREASLVEALREAQAAARLYPAGGSPPYGATVSQWRAFEATVRSATHTLQSQRAAQASGSTMAWGDDPRPTGGGGTQTGSGKDYTDPGSWSDPGSREGKSGGGGGGGGFLQSLSAPWALAGLLGVGAVVAVWYSTSTDGGK